MLSIVRVLVLCLCCCSVTLSHAWATEQLTPVPTAWMDEHETFLMWFAKEQGWDHEVGLDLELNFFDTGHTMLQALEAGEWVLSAMGAVRAIPNYIKYNLQVVGIANDESYTNGVVVHKDSPIVAVKGWNKDYPNVFGDPKSIKGKKFLVVTTSSAHYTIYSWLKVFGLTEKDITIKSMGMSLAQEAFRKHLADGVGLWAPDLFSCMENNVLVTDLHSCGKTQPVVLIAEPKYAKEHPDIIAKTIGIYLRAVDYMQSKDPKDLLDEYIRFFDEWADKRLDRNLALLDLTKHPIYNLKQQLVFFDKNSKDNIYQWLNDIAEFFYSTGRITEAEYAKVKDSSVYALDTYLKMLADTK